MPILLRVLALCVLLAGCGAQPQEPARAPEPEAVAEANGTGAFISTPLAPAVGAATILPIAAFASPTAKEKMTASLIFKPKILGRALSDKASRSFNAFPPVSPLRDLMPVSPY